MTNAPGPLEMSEGTRIGVGRTAEVYSWGEGQILKLYRPDFERTWIEHEARVGRIVAEAGLAAPAVGDVIEAGGRSGIVMERIVGPSMLDDLARRPWVLVHHALQFAEMHAAMHTCQRPELPSQRDSLARAIEYAPALPEESRRQLSTTLLRLPDGDAVCHGDYHPDNLIVSPRGVIVIDWLTVTRGTPIADVTRTVLLFRVAVLPAGMPAAKRIMTQLLRRAFVGLYLRTYRRLRPLSDTEIAIWLPILAAARLNERIPAEETALLRLAGAESNTGHK
jgi:uncharacterized protein (TIGR02172 family)